MSEVKEKDVLVKSKERVKGFGEVYTPPAVVKDMCDLDKVKDETYKLDTTILEPACGNGNFLVELIERKMITADQMVPDKTNVDAYYTAVLTGVSTVYGIDILIDNVNESRRRMKNIIIEQFNKHFGNSPEETIPEPLNGTIDTILRFNIIFGNTLENKMFKVVCRKKASEESVERRRKPKIKDEFNIHASEVMNETYFEYPITKDSEGKPESAGEIMFLDYKFNGNKVHVDICPLRNIEVAHHSFDFEHWSDIQSISFWPMTGYDFKNSSGVAGEDLL